MSTEKKTRILLADDHDIVRRGLRTLLEMRSDWEVCAEVADGRAAVQQSEALQPDVVILDLSMPELNGLEAARRIVAHCPHSQVLMLTMHETEQFVREALAAGVRGYILKTDAGRDLHGAVDAVLRGETCFNSRLAATIYAAEFASGKRRRTKSQAGLTPREREILQLLAEGHKNRDVGKALNISVKTAETHRARIMSKLKMESVADLVRYAIRNGLVSP